MPPERPRPNVDQVREALRERDERADEPEPAQPPAPPERDEDDGAASDDS
jgi:hypothetical protein